MARRAFCNPPGSAMRSSMWPVRHLFGATDCAPCDRAVRLDDALTGGVFSWQELPGCDDCVGSFGLVNRMSKSSGTAKALRWIFSRARANQTEYGEFVLMVFSVFN